MTDQLERDLTTLLHARAAATPITEAPLDRLVREGRAASDVRRRRTRLRTVGAAAAVVLVAAIPLSLRGFSDDDSTPEPAGVPEVVNTSTERPASVADLPVGPPPAVPYIVDDTLHVGAHELDAAADAALWHASGTVLLIEGPEAAERGPGGGRTIVRAVRGDEIVTLAEFDDVRGHPALSPNGDVAAVAHGAGPDLKLTTFDPVTGRTLSEIRQKVTGGVALHVDDSGRVYWTPRKNTFLASEGSAPRRIQLPEDSVLAQVTSAGVVLTSGTGGFEYGTVGDDGRFVQRARIGAPRDGLTTFLADDRHLVHQTRAITGRNDRGTVVDLRSGARRDLLLPEDVSWTMPLALEGGRNVLLEAVPAEEPYTRGTRWLLRCELVSGRCDRILAELDPGSRLRIGRATLPAR